MGKIAECSFEELIPKGAKIIVGLSGGADSITLLDSLHKKGYMCIAAHCNFHIRNEEANRDSKFAHSQANARKIPFYQIDFNTNEYASIQGISTEMAARNLRYQWFAELKMREKADYIAVAHHADDSIETFLINLSRGTGLKGLSGIKFQQGDIIRPLLQFTRKEILEYIEEQHLTYVDDSTNFENVYLRNKFRNQVIPLLEEINPSFRQNMMQTMSHLREAELFVSHQLSSITKRSLENGRWTISKEEVFSSPDSHFILFETLNPLGFSNDVVNDLIHLGMNGTGKHFFSDQYELRCERKEWEIVPIQKKRETIYEIKGLEDVQNLPIRLKISLVPAEKITFQRDNRNCYVDFDKIAFPLTLRNCKSGDYFYPFGMKGRKKTSDFFIDNHYSQSKKENTWVLTTSNDEIIWIVGARADNRFRIGASTQQVYIFTIE